MLPGGNYENLKFRIHRQPFAEYWFWALDSGLFNRFVAMGVTQSGKTLMGFSIPVLYHLFEYGEDVIVGVTGWDMAADKWKKFLLPVIQRSQYERYLPTHGPGSKGGLSADIQFTHGPSLRFMTGGGSDKAVAGYTARVVAVTETDGMDEAQTTSREGNRLKQLEARTKHFDARKRVFFECTASNRQGFIWQAWERSTQCQIANRCPNCERIIIPITQRDRAGRLLPADNWREAAKPFWSQFDDPIQVRDNALFICPKCFTGIEERDRLEMNRPSSGRSILVYGGQTTKSDDTALDRLTAVPSDRPSEGSQLGRQTVAESTRHALREPNVPDEPLESDEIVGEPRKSETFGLRWNCVNNAFQTPGTVALEEFEAEKEGDDDLVIACHQFNWALPYDPTEINIEVLTPELVTRRVDRYLRGEFPPDTYKKTVGVDVGKKMLHWVVVAWDELYRGHITDYGVWECQSQYFGVEKGIKVAFEGLHEMLETDIQPNQVFCDSRYQTETVYRACKQNGAFWKPCFGYGPDQGKNVGSRSYSKPKKGTANVKWIGDQLHFIYLPEYRTYRVEINSAEWKMRVHEGFMCEEDAENSLFLFRPDKFKDRIHNRFSHHVTSARAVKRFVPGAGWVTEWDQVKREDHLFDSLYLACAAAHFCMGYVPETRGDGDRTVTVETVEGMKKHGKDSLAQTKRAHNSASRGRDEWARGSQVGDAASDLA